MYIFWLVYEWPELETFKLDFWVSSCLVCIDRGNEFLVEISKLLPDTSCDRNDGIQGNIYV